MTHSYCSTRVPCDRKNTELIGFPEHWANRSVRIKKDSQTNKN